MAENKVGGVFRVSLAFSRHDKGPDVEWMFVTSGEPFRQAILDWVGQYRLPCLADGMQPVVALQEFQFVPGDGRKVVRSEARERRRPHRSLTCLTGAEKLPYFPNAAGIVIAQAIFTDVASPPRVEIKFASNGQVQAAVRRHMAGWRLPCMSEGAPEVRFEQRFRFDYEGDRRSALKDSTLLAFLAAVENIDTNRVRFDFSTMSCPFDVLFELRRPYLPNSVGEVERSDPNRREFIEWLRQLDLKFPKSVRDELIGDSMTIFVPCGVLDLT